MHRCSLRDCLSCQQLGTCNTYFHTRRYATATFKNCSFCVPNVTLGGNPLLSTGLSRSLPSPSLVPPKTPSVEGIRSPDRICRTCHVPISRDISGQIGIAPRGAHTFLRSYVQSHALDQRSANGYPLCCLNCFDRSLPPSLRLPDRFSRAGLICRSLHLLH